MALPTFVTQHTGLWLGADASGPATAARDLAPGQVVFACLPAALCVEDASVCAHCMKRPEADRGEKLNRCGVCKTSYCSRACQADAWGEHKGACKLLGWLQEQLSNREDFALALLTSYAARGKRLLPTLTPKDGEAVDPASVPGSAASAGVYVHNLKDVGSMPRNPLTAGAHGSEDDAAAAAPPSARVAAVVQAIRRAGLLPETIPDDVGAALAARIGPNVLPITDSLLVRRGVAVAPLAAHLRHSCAPNCVATFVPITALQRELGLSAPWSAADAAKAAGLTEPGAAPVASLALVVRTIADVPAGSDLTLSRVDVTLPAAARAKALRKLAAPTSAPAAPVAACACPACTEDSAQGDAYGPAPAASASGASQQSRDSDLDLARLFASSAAEIAADPGSRTLAPTVAKLASSGLGLARVPRPSASHATETLRLRLETAILAHTLRLLCAHLPPFHPDVMRVVDRLYGVAMVAGDYASATPLGYHQVAFHRHACRRCPGHPAVGLQAHALADLLMNTAVDAAAHYEESGGEAAVVAADTGARSGGVNEEDVAAIDAATRASAVLRRVCALPPDAPSEGALPEALFSAAASAYQEAVDVLLRSLGSSCPLVPLARERVDMLRSIVEEAEQRAAAAQAPA